MWDRCWSTARYHLRLSNREFFRLTPRQLHLLMERHHERATHNELLAGIVAATIANHSFAPPKRALSPGDFMPSEWARKAERKRKPKLDRKHIAENVRAFLMGRVEAQEAA